MKIITKQQLINRENLKSINEKIEELKKEFRKKKYNQIGELYKIKNLVNAIKSLNEIIIKYDK